MAKAQTRDTSSRRSARATDDQQPAHAATLDGPKPHHAPDSPEQEAFLALVRTQCQLCADFERLFREHDLSMATYCTLRVLRSAGIMGRKCQEIGEHLIAATPDVTRLIDRLQDSGYCVRLRSKTDRRVVIVRITQAGLDVLTELDRPVAELHQRQFGHFRRDQLRTLVELLEACRSASAGDTGRQGANA